MNNIIRKKGGSGFIKKSAVCLPAIAISAMGGLLHASALEEVVVTAQKREQTLHDVSIAVSAWGGEALSKLGVTSSEDEEAYGKPVWYGASVSYKW